MTRGILNPGLRAAKQLADNPQSTLSVHPGALGDVILFGHLLCRIEGRITILAGNQKARLLVGVGIADRALGFEAMPMHEVFTDTPVGQCRLASLLGKHQRLVSCFGAGEPRAELRLKASCGAREAVFLPVRPPVAYQGHLVELWSGMLGVPLDAAGPAAWNVPQSWRAAAADALGKTGAEPGRPYVAIHPGAGAPEKCWPLERFMKLGKTLAAGASERIFSGATVGVVLVLGPVELDRWDSEAIEHVRRQFPTLLCPELSVLAGLLAGANAFVGNDCGVSHLAAAVGTPTVALFGPSLPRHFAPLGRLTKTINAEPMSDISIEQVLKALAVLRG